MWPPGVPHEGANLPFNEYAHWVSHWRIWMCSVLGIRLRKAFFWLLSNTFSSGIESLTKCFNFSTFCVGEHKLLTVGVQKMKDEVEQLNQLLSPLSPALSPFAKLSFVARTLATSQKLDWDLDLATLGTRVSEDAAFSVVPPPPALLIACKVNCVRCSKWSYSKCEVRFRRSQVGYTCTFFVFLQPLIWHDRTPHMGQIKTSAYPFISSLKQFVIHGRKWGGTFLRVTPFFTLLKCLIPDTERNGMEHTYV